MPSLDDARWSALQGAYRRPFDPRPQLRNLEAGQDVAAAWKDLWGGLHHQGDVGEASFAAVPHLVRIHIERGLLEWNTYALVAAIELARASGSNPDVPEWLKQEYEESLERIALAGLSDLHHVQDNETARSILAILAIWRGAKTYGRVLLTYTEDELLEMET